MILKNGKRIDGMGDSMPIGSIVEYNGTDIPDGWEEVLEPEDATVYIGPAEPTDGQKVWVRTSDKTIYIQNNDGDYEKFLEPDIVESGSNENGSWVKYANGDLVCRHMTWHTELEMTVSYGGVCYSNQNVSWKFPQPFIEAPVVTTSYRSSGIGGINLNTISNSEVGGAPFNARSWSGASCTIGWIAMGKWK